MSNDEYMVEMYWKCSSCGHVNLGRHTVCVSCGNPMDESEHYVMPDDPSVSNAVTDPELLRMARADENWRCPFCGSSQRAYDGSCANCGAGKPDSKDSSSHASATSSQSPTKPAKSRTRFVIALAVVGAVMLVMMLVGAGAFLVGGSGNAAGFHPFATYKDVPATVATVHWTRSVTVKRWRLVDKEGFAESRPADAQQVKPAGKRVHHTDKVPDGYRTESYTETVPDGYRTETYTASEPCGQTCTSRPRSCRNVCSSRKNGFASCRQVCTGGGQSCRTKYCMRTKTRQVPKTRVVHRTRQVPKFRDVPRYQPWFTWKQWAWATDRVVKREGDDNTPLWPTDERIHLGKNLGPKEKERLEKSQSFVVGLRTPDGKILTIHPKSEVEFRALKLGSSQKVRVHDSGKMEMIKSTSVTPSGERL